MHRILKLVATPLIAAFSILTTNAQNTFVIGDSNTTVNNPNGLASGDEILFQGQIITNTTDGVRLTGLPANISLTFTSSSIVRVIDPDDSSWEAVSIAGDFNGIVSNAGIIESRRAEGVQFENDFSGIFTNSGRITSTPEEGVHFQGNFLGDFLNTGGIFTLTSGGEDAVEVDADFVGSFTNTGTILSENDDGVLLEGGFTGSFLNTGLISADSEGVYFGDDFNGSFTNHGTITSTGTNAFEFSTFAAGSTFTNSGMIRGATDGIDLFGPIGGSWLNTGIIEAQSGLGIDAQSATATTATFTNRGGRILGSTGALNLGAGNATLNIEGPSHIQGTMFGGPGAGDTIRFQNIRGISDAKRAELEALAGADPTQVTSVTLFGETLSFTEFESIQVELASLQSYGDLLRPGLGNYGTALDNVIQLNDEIRGFLNALNDADLDTLNKIAGTTSGQVIVSGLDDFVQHQDTNLFSLFMNEFSTLRGDPSGGGSLAANERSGLFTREIQVGVTINEPIVDTTHAFVTGYVGNGTQDPDLVRSESSIDNTSILFGFGNHVSNDWRLGFWGGYVDNEATVDSFGSYLRNEAGYVGVNANYLSDDLFANVLLGYGFHDQLSTRRDFQGSVFDGDAVGNQGIFQAQVGRDYYFGDAGAAKVSPYLGFTLSALSMGGFTEDGPALTRLRFEGETTVSAQSVLGVNVSGYKETGSGWTKPKFDAAWWHEFAGADDYGVALATPGFLNSFQVTSPVANRDRAVVQAGLEFGLDKWEGVSFDATYFGTFGGDGYSSHGGALSATFEF